MRSVECVDRFLHIPHSSFYYCCDYRAVVTPLPHTGNNVTAQR